MPPIANHSAAPTLDFDRPLLTSAVFVGLVAVAASSRLISIAPNVAAVAAAAMLAGVLFRSRTLAICVPICAMLLSDLFVGSYAPLVMVSVYSCLALPAIAARLFRADAGIARLIATAVGCSTVFFLVTNLAVWLSGTGIAAPKTFAGLLACYTAAIPFYRLTLLGDLSFALAMFGACALVRRTLLAPHPAAA